MKQKVLFVYFEPLESGQTTHVISLVNGLNKDKYDITVVLPAHLRKSRSAFNQTGATIIPLPMRKIFWNPKSIASLTSLIRRQYFDIVHVHSQEAGLLVRVIARIAGARIIIYTPQCTHIRRNNLIWLYRYIEKVLSSITNKIISVSETDRTRIIKWGIPTSKVITINNGIDPGISKDSLDMMALKNLHELDGKHPLVMQVGRLSYQKNPLMFVEGAARVVNELPDVHFLLVGDGPLKDEVENYIQEIDIQGNVHCLGWQDNADRLIAIADVITLTSRWEGLPYVLLEAMAWSRPVVAPDVNGCPELVENGVTGLIVPKDDIASWANSVIAILSDPHMSKDMGQNGNKRVRRYFSLAKMIKQTEGVYDRLTLTQ